MLPTDQESIQEALKELKSIKTPGSIYALVYQIKMSDGTKEYDSILVKSGKIGNPAYLGKEKIF